MATEQDVTVYSLAREGALCSALQGDVPGVGVHLGCQLIALGLRQRRDIVARL